MGKQRRPWHNELGHRDRWRCYSFGSLSVLISACGGFLAVGVRDNAGYCRVEYAREAVSL